MTKINTGSLRFVLAVMAIGLASVSAAEKVDSDPKHQLPRPDGKAPDTTKPVKVFILMGQSNMVGMGDLGPDTKQGTLTYLTKTEKKYPWLIDDAGNVKTVEARDFWREADVSPNPRQGYHYNRNAETYMEVGLSLGWAMADLLQNKKSESP